MNVWINGELVNKSQAQISVFDHGLLYGDGVFEGIRIYSGKIFQVRAHMDRLYESAQLIRLDIPYDGETLVDAMYETLRSNGIEDGYIRLVVTRGEGTLGMNPFICRDASVIIIADGIQLYDKSLYESGLPVIIAKTVRCTANMLDPKVKSLNYLNNIRAKIEAIDAGVMEAIMLNARGRVAECTGDNIFLVRNGELFTPHPDEGILLGITRDVIIRLALRMGMTVHETQILPEQVFAAEECFLTGTAAEVIPVTSVDGKPMGNGEVGPITRKMLGAFQKFIRSDEAEGR